MTGLGGHVAALDARVDAAIERWRGDPVADRVFYAASAVGDHSLVWFLLGASRAMRSQQRWRTTLQMTAVLALESTLVNLGIKSLFHRRRPKSDVDRPHRLRLPRTSSFPSGHATSAFTAAGLLADGDPLWPVYYLTAIVVAASRVYVKIHHASDVLAGIPIGILLGRLGRRFLPLPPRRAPAVAGPLESPSRPRG